VVMNKKQVEDRQVERGSVVERIASDADRLAYIRVLQNRNSGASSTQTDTRAAERYLKSEKLRTGLAFAAAVPKKYLCQWGEVDYRQIDNAALRYGLPAKGPTWSVPEVCHWLFRFLAEYEWHFRKRESEIDPLLMGAETPWLVAYRKERTLTVRVQRLGLEGVMVPVSAVLEVLQRAGEQLRQGAMLLKQDCDARALEIYNLALDGYDAAIDRFFDEAAPSFAEDEEVSSFAGGADGEHPGPFEVNHA